MKWSTTLSKKIEPHHDGIQFPIQSGKKTPSTTHTAKQILKAALQSVNSPYVLSVLSMFAFCSIVMTYFGVNFYLSGLHSYAQGDPVPVPTFVYVCLAVMVTISITAFAKRDLKLLKPSN